MLSKPNDRSRLLTAWQRGRRTQQLVVRGTSVRPAIGFRSESRRCEGTQRPRALDREPGVPSSPATRASIFGRASRSCASGLGKALRASGSSKGCGRSSRCPSRSRYRRTEHRQAVLLSSARSATPDLDRFGWPRVRECEMGPSSGRLVRRRWGERALARPVPDSAAQPLPQMWHEGRHGTPRSISSRHAWGVKSSLGRPQRVRDGTQDERGRHGTCERHGDETKPALKRRQVRRPQSVRPRRAPARGARRRTRRAPTRRAAPRPWRPRARPRRRLERRRP
jgi:hypothetical protein